MDIKPLENQVALESPNKKAANSQTKTGDTQCDVGDSRLKKACAEFEGILLQYMFESMQRTVDSGGIFKESHQKKMYESMFTQEVSATLARGRGVGLGAALYRQVKNYSQEK